MSNNPRFLSPDIPIIGESLKLGAEESAHCAKVLRMKPGETICLIDGSGTVAEAVITTVLSKGTEVRIIKKDFYHKKSRITLAFGLTKPQALEHIFRKCTELGIQAFQPLVTDHSLHPNSWNTERWSKILLEACKQCQDPWVPELQEPLALKDWLTQTKTPSLLFFCDELSRKHSEVTIGSESASLLIGPEGGWSDSERKQIASHTPVHLGLGPNRLRSETACVAAVTLLKFFLGELK